MILFDFQFDATTMEVFPPDIANNPAIVYHGTCDCYSEQIENEGIVPGKIPFTKCQAQELFGLLNLPAIAKYDFWNGKAQPDAKYIKEYTTGASNRPSSMSVVSTSALKYANKHNLGGQVFNVIRRSKLLVEQAILQDSFQLDSVPEGVLELWKLADHLENSSGVIYAVGLPRDLAGIEFNAGIVYSRKVLKSLVAKVVVPSDFNVTILDAQRIREMSIRKQFSPNGLLRRFSN